jgi:hypothetical protein
LEHIHFQASEKRASFSETCRIWSCDLRKAALCATILILAAGRSPSALAAAIEPCPIRPESSLKYADVFDGPPEDLASLMADKPGKTSGYFTLGHIYDAGRFVTVRCEYADRVTTDVEISTKIKGCTYAFDKNKKLSFSCC